MSNSSTKLIDVLIVGAGPVGLLLANELANYGCSFRIVEKLAARSPYSKALAVSPRTTEVLENRGYVDPFITKGVKLAAMCGVTPDGHKVMDFGIANNIDSRYDYMLVISQSDTERILYEKLTKTMGEDRLEREMELVGYEQVKLDGDDFERVVARIKRLKDGKEEDIHARFIVGCDGVHSRVRKNYEDWTYDGKTIKDEFAMADCSIANITELDFVPNNGKIILSPKGIALLLPWDNENNAWRVIIVMSGYHTDTDNVITHGIQKPDDNPLTLEDIQEMLDSRFDKKIELTNATWVTKFRINERMTKTFRRGCAFLAGDSAHCHSPMGGQGLNTGLQDAHNLAWKLHLVLHKLIPNPERLLDSYTQEREPIARAVLSATGGGSMVAFGNEWPIRFIRENIIPFIFSIKPLRKYIAQIASQKALSYPQSNAVLPNSSNWLVFGKSLVKAGTLALDGVLTGPDTTGQTTFYDALREMHEHRLVLFAGSNKDEALDHLIQITTRFSTTVKPMVIATATPEVFQADRPNLPVYLDTDGSLHHKYGVPKGKQVLIFVRPDMFVGAAIIIAKDDLKEFEAYLGGYLLESA